MTKFETENKEKQKIEEIQNNTVYAKESKVNYIPSFYYLVF